MPNILRHKNLRIGIKKHENLSYAILMEKSPLEELHKNLYVI